MIEKILLTDTAEQTAALFGNFDRNINIIEKSFGVNITNRDTEKTLRRLLLRHYEAFCKRGDRDALSDRSL